MADLEHYPHTGARQQTGTAEVGIDNAGRHTDEHVGQVYSGHRARRMPGFSTMKVAVAVMLAL
jgi:hypothetical protein